MFTRFMLLTLLNCCVWQGYAQLALNTAFGNNGTVELGVDYFNEPVAITGTGTDTFLILANATGFNSPLNTDVVLARFNSAGRQDSSFALNGITRFDFAGMDVSTANAMVQLSNGSLYVLGRGYSYTNDTFQPVCLARLLPGGQIDSSFCNNGTQYLQFNAIEEFPRVLKKTSSGQLLAGGFSIDSMHNHVNVPAIARLNQDGSPDTLFGEKGKAYLRFDGGTISATRHLTGGVLYDVLELGDGSILAAGGYSDVNNLIAYIARINGSGIVDTGFFDKGYMAIDFTPFANSQVVRLVQQNANIIWFGATSYSTQGRDFYVGQLNLQQQDFNTSSIDFNGCDDVIADLLLSPAGSIMLVGKSTLPQHATGAYQSDYFSVQAGPTQGFPFAQQAQITYSPDTMQQSGAVAATLLNNGSLIVYGFNTLPSGQSNLRLIAIDTTMVLSAAQPAETRALQVYPNPANAAVTLQWQAGPAEVWLTDFTGRTVGSFSFQHSPATIPLVGYTSGIYFLNIHGNGAAGALKLVINR